MKLLILSDTHLQNDLFTRITNQHPDMDYYIHCGDSSLEIDDPLLKKYLTVKGNHDSASFPLEITFKVNNYNCLVVHGQNHNVYFGNDYLYQYMLKNNIDLCFHGHTHVPAFSIIDDHYIINPGSVMINRGSYGFGTYAIVVIENNSLQVNYYNSETDQECTKLALEDGKTVLEEFKELLKQKS
ncbi:MAG: metallophosphoesterase family protein [Thomasclavelia sp.]